MKKLNILITFAVIFAFQQKSHAQQTVSNSVISGGGTSASNSTYSITGTLGQPVIGMAGNTSYIMNVGFWYLTSFAELNIIVERTVNSDTGVVAVKFEDNSQIKLKFNSGEVSGKTVNVTALGSTLSGETDPDKKAIEGKTAAFYNIETGITGEFEAVLEVTFTEANLSAANITLEQADILVLSYYRTDISKWWKESTTIDKVNKTAKATISHFSTWALVDSTDPGVVPVELSSFTTKSDINNEVVLDWVTLSETNNYGFYIERSTDKMNFKEICFVKGKGNSFSEERYSFIDTDSKSPGTYYYRLKQVDFNGSYEYSDILEIEVSSPKEFKLEQNYPNPFNPETKIRYQLPEPSQVSLKIYNLLGQEVKTLINTYQMSGSYTVKWDGTNDQRMKVASGVYIYIMRAGSFLDVKKVVFLQ